MIGPAALRWLRVFAQDLRTYDEHHRAKGWSQAARDAWIVGQVQQARSTLERDNHWLPFLDILGAESPRLLELVPADTQHVPNAEIRRTDALSLDVSRPALETRPLIRDGASRSPQPAVVATSVPPSAIAPSPPQAVESIVGNRYQLTRRVGEGGTGEVYEARHLHIDKTIAIKLLRRDVLGSLAIETRFREEARLASKIGSENIVRIDDFGVLSDGRNYLGMELIEGPALAELARRDVAPLQLLDIFIGAASGLEKAHEHGIVHGDVKPQNILIAHSGDGWVAKVTDFGIAHVVASDAADMRGGAAIRGTPFYMAPEQVLGFATQPSIDVYALGVSMFECFAGSLPFRGESADWIMTQHVVAHPDPVDERAASVRRTLPLGLSQLIMSCLEKDPDARPPGMREVRETLESIRVREASSHIGVLPAIAMSGDSTTKTMPTLDPRTIQALPSRTLLAAHRLGELFATNHGAADGLRSAARLVVAAEHESRGHDAREMRTHAAFRVVQAIEHTLVSRLTRAKSRRGPEWVGSLPKRARKAIEGKNNPSLNTLAELVGPRTRIAPEPAAVDLQTVLGIPEGLEEHALAAGKIRNVLAHVFEYTQDQTQSFETAAPYVSRVDVDGVPRIDVPESTLDWLFALARSIVSATSTRGHPRPS